MEYQLKKNQTLTKLFVEKICILNKQKNLNTTYMKKLKIIFQKWMNKCLKQRKIDTIKLNKMERDKKNKQKFII